MGEGHRSASCKLVGVDTLQMRAVEELLFADNGCRASIYLPTHRAGKQVEGDRIRLKNLLRVARTDLEAEGLSRREIDEMIAPADDLVKDPVFWRYQADGLAVFVDRRGISTFRLPVAFQEEVVVGPRAHITPLLPIVLYQGPFWVLALSQNEVRLLHGSRAGLEDVELRDVPKSLRDALGTEGTEKQVQSHSVRDGGRTGTVFHGHGIGAEVDKDRRLRFYRAVESGLREVLGEDHIPLILAGVERELTMYREVNTYRSLADEEIVGNVERTGLTDLHAKAWEIVAPILERERDEALRRFREMDGTGHTASDADVVIDLAEQGRIEVLLVGVPADTATIQPAEHERRADDAVARTLASRGIVYAVDEKDMPGGAHLAAICRY